MKQGENAEDIADKIPYKIKTQTSLMNEETVVVCLYPKKTYLEKKNISWEICEEKKFTFSFFSSFHLLVNLSTCPPYSDHQLHVDLKQNRENISTTNGSFCRVKLIPSAWHDIPEFEKSFILNKYQYIYLKTYDTYLLFLQNLNLLDHLLVYEGSLTWRLTKQKSIDLYAVLFEDIVVLFQKQDEKLMLRCQSTMLVHGKDDTKFTHCPIIIMRDCMLKPVATGKFKLG